MRDIEVTGTFLFFAMMSRASPTTFLRAWEVPSNSTPLGIKSLNNSSL